MVKYPIKRILKNKKHYYYSATGLQIKDTNLINQIKKLGIPPAYKIVDIFEPSAKIQAISVDDKGRKQYKYHSLFVNERVRKKYRNLIHFVSAYAKIMSKLESKYRNMKNGTPTTKEDIICLILGLMNTCKIRPGCMKHFKQNGSYGTTTLLRKHFIIKNKEIRLKFKGKSGVINTCTINKKNKLYSVLLNYLKSKKNKDEYIFTYQDVLITQYDINNYLRQISKTHISAKAFRTYHANIDFINSALELHQTILKPNILTNSNIKSNFKEITNNLATNLHHTSATFKQSYLYPQLKELYISNYKTFIKKFKNKNPELSFIKFIKKNTSNKKNIPKKW
jgi:DNA topoisomerase-1